MTKRIIDSMTAEQIDSGWGTFGPQDLLEYLKTICKPAPNWEDDASADNPILCWVSDNPIAKSGLYEKVDHVTEISEGGYAGLEICWQYARPISSDEIWQPAENLASPLEADRLEELLGLASKLDEICAALEDLKIDDNHSNREQYIYNGAVHDAIQVVKNTEPGE